MQWPRWQRARLTRPYLGMDLIRATAHSREHVNDEEIPAKAKQLVKDLEEVKASAEELSEAVAKAIRTERSAGLPYRGSDPESTTKKKKVRTRKSGKKAATRKKR